MLKRTLFLFVLIICLLFVSCDGDLNSVGKTMQKLNRNIWVDYEVPATLTQGITTGEDGKPQLAEESVLGQAVARILNPTITEPIKDGEVETGKTANEIVVETLKELAKSSDAKEVVDTLKEIPATSADPVALVTKAIPETVKLPKDLQSPSFSEIGNSLAEAIKHPETATGDDTLSDIANILNGTGDYTQYGEITKDIDKEVVVAAIDDIIGIVANGTGTEGKDASVANVMAAGIVSDLLTGVEASVIGAIKLAEKLTSCVDALDVLAGTDNISTALTMFENIVPSLMNLLKN